MTAAAQSNKLELQTSQLALEKATDPQVREFAQRMIDDHGKAGRELATLATSKGVELPEGPSLMQQAKLKLLEFADGGDFDRRYSESMSTAHNDTIELFQTAVNEATDPDVKAFAEKTLPTLREHLEMAKRLPGVAESASSASVTTQ